MRERRLAGELSGKVAIGGPKSSFIFGRDLGEPNLARFVDLVRPMILSLAQPNLARPAMTIFRLKQLASTSVHAAAGAMHWNYDRAELIADGVVHVVGVCFGLVAATVLIVLTAVYATAFEMAAVSVYVAGPAGDAGAVGDLQSLAGVARQMGAAPLRSFGDLSADRRDLHAVHHAAEGQHLRASRC